MTFTEGGRAGLTARGQLSWQHPARLACHRVSLSFSLRTSSALAPSSSPRSQGQAEEATAPLARSLDHREDPFAEGPAGSDPPGPRSLVVLVRGETKLWPAANARAPPGRSANTQTRAFSRSWLMGGRLRGGRRAARPAPARRVGGGGAPNVYARGGNSNNNTPSAPRAATGGTAA